MSFDATTTSSFVTIQELAVDWRVTEAHLYALVKQGRLRAYRIGRRVIIAKSEVKSFLERNATASAAA